MLVTLLSVQEVFMTAATLTNFLPGWFTNHLEHLILILRVNTRFSFSFFSQSNL